LALFSSVVRLLGVRRSAAALGFGLLAAGLGLLGAGSSGLTAPRYEVSAPLLATGGLFFACFAYDLMDPVHACGGIEVRGVDASRLAGGDSYPGRRSVSQAMRLVGTWDGHALTLTEPPQPAAQSPGLVQPCPRGQESQPGPDTMALQRQVTDALRAHGTEVLMSTGCDSTTVGVVVPVADDATVNWLKSHYRVQIAGWLRRLPSGP
jgi:hypothetical protein